MRSAIIKNINIMFLLAKYMYIVREYWLFSLEIASPTPMSNRKLSKNKHFSLDVIYKVVSKL